MVNNALSLCAFNRSGAEALKVPEVLMEPVVCFSLTATPTRASPPAAQLV